MLLGHHFSSFDDRLRRAKTSTMDLVACVRNAQRARLAAKRVRQGMRSQFAVRAAVGGGKAGLAAAAAPLHIDWPELARFLFKVRARV